MLLHEVIEFAARWTPDDTALLFDDRSWTFGELWGEILTMGEWLSSRVEPGERVAIVSDNRSEVVVALYAVPMVGAIAMLGNTRLVPSEIADLVNDVRPSLLIGATEQLERLRDVLDVPMVDFDDLPAPSDSPMPIDDFPPIGPDDVAWIIHTSGTTGRPKGALLTHRGLGAGVLATALARPLGPDDNYLFPFPLFHVAAYGVVHAHFRGRPVVLVPKFDAVPVMAAIERHRVTTMSLAPTMIAMLLDHPDRSTFDLSSVRNIFYGASAIPLDVAAARPRRVRLRLRAGIRHDRTVGQPRLPRRCRPRAGRRRRAAPAGRRGQGHGNGVDPAGRRRRDRCARRRCTRRGRRDPRARRSGREGLLGAPGRRRSGVRRRLVPYR